MGMQTGKCAEDAFLEKIIENEGLIVAKTKIYSRLLTETALAELMESLALKREKSKAAWLEILTGEPQNSSENPQTGGAGTSRGGDGQ